MRNNSCVVHTSDKVFHIVFTYSFMNGSRCYVNGKLEVISSASRDTWKSPGANALYVNTNYNLSELFLWSSEMTAEQVMEEYEGLL